MLNDFTETSPADTTYNCIAWAAGDSANWWWPQLYYWPPGMSKETTVEAFIAAYGTVGYEPCEDETLEEGFEKVAIYVNVLGRPTHAALQLPDGNWTSKLGVGPDGTHPTLQTLRVLYGGIGAVVRRPRAAAENIEGPNSQANE